jgi:hypothetical protein
MWRLVEFVHMSKRCGRAPRCVSAARFRNDAVKEADEGHSRGLQRAVYSPETMRPVTARYALTTCISAEYKENMMCKDAPRRTTPNMVPLHQCWY